MKRILLKLEDEEHQRLSTLKGTKSWKQFLTDDLATKSSENGGEIDIKPKKTTRSKKADRKRGGSDPGNTERGDQGGDVEPGSANNATTGEEINFTGGRQHMTKDADGSTGTPEYKCQECGHQFNGKPKHCPGCGVELNWEEP